MIKSELITKIALQNPHLYERDIENVVSAILDEVSAALAENDRVELRGFGAFSTKLRETRGARNPRTGAKVMVGTKYVPAFKMGKDLRERLNSDL
jgi:integration host factor subunit beta